LSVARTPFSRTDRACGAAIAGGCNRIGVHPDARRGVRAVALFARVAARLPSGAECVRAVVFVIDGNLERSHEIVVTDRSHDDLDRLCLCVVSDDKLDFGSAGALAADVGRDGLSGLARDREPQLRDVTKVRIARHPQQNGSGATDIRRGLSLATGSRRRRYSRHEEDQSGSRSRHESVRHHVLVADRELISGLRSSVVQSCCCLS
jgi:hypothetical protein